MWFKSVAQNIVTYSKGVLTAHKSKCELLIDEIRYSKSAESSRNKCS